MSKTFIAVGGTGQHTLLSYLHLSLLGDFQPEKYCLFDADVTSDANTVMGAINAFVHANDGYGLDISGEIIDPKPRFGKGLTLFRDIFVNEIEVDRPLFDTFFEPDTQHQVDINAGYYGQPMVGAICIHHRLEQLSREKDKKFTTFLSGTTKDDQNVVAVVGSNFGGTGAGGAPIIGRYIHDQHIEAHGSLDRLFHLFISHHKWYSIRNIPPSSKIDDRTHERNTNAGLSFYEDKLSQVFDKIVMFGLPQNIEREYSGENSQRENKDLPYLLSALIVNTYFASDFRSLKSGGHDQRLNRFVEEEPVQFSFIRLTGVNSERERIWDNVPFRDSLEGNVTISHFLAYLLFWMAGYVISPYKRDTLVIENHFPREFDAILAKVNARVLAGNLKKLAENLQGSLEWLSGFNDARNPIDFKFKHLGTPRLEWTEMRRISDSVEPKFQKVFRASFRQLFMRALKGHFSHAINGSEKELALEVKKALRADLYANLK